MLLAFNGVREMAAKRKLNNELVAAVYHRNTLPAKLLLARGAEPNTKGPKGVMPLSWAASYGDLELMKALLDAGADPICRGGWLPALQMAVDHGNADAVDLLLERGADPNYENRNSPGSWALVIAVEGGKTRIVKALLRAGADPNTLDHSTPLLAVARKKKSELIVAALLAAGATDDGPAPSGASD